LLSHVMLKNMDEAKPPKRPATYDDLLKVPDHMVAEILDGELHVSPRPAPPHAYAAARLTGRLDDFDLGARDPGGWLIVMEPELHLGPDVLVPDVAGWRQERLPALPSTAFFPLAPDWACEVLSPSTERIDRTKKLRIYAREGVRYLWLVNALTRTLEILRLESGEWVMAATHSDDVVIRPEPFEALPFDLGRLWGKVALDSDQ
jgi:Uma2 family endonuclease